MPNSNPQIIVNINTWVERVKNDPHRYFERQAIEVLLATIGRSSKYGGKLFLKGGILMGIVHASPRQTVDIDFTADFTPTDSLEDELKADLEPNFRRTAAQLGYPGLVCKIQSIEKKPRKDNFSDAKFPALIMKIAYARINTPALQRLITGQCQTTLKVEMSFNEPVEAIELIKLDNETIIHTYSITELVAEKLRALIQQPIRNRNRRQDIYDIAYLLKKESIGEHEKQQIFNRFVAKSNSRNITPTQDSLSDKEVIRRASKEWDTLQIELEELPDFETEFKLVEDFYQSLPWGTLKGESKGPDTTVTLPS